MVLTDEKDTSKYPLASLESANINTERLLYSGLDSGRINKSTVPGYPADGTTSPNDYLQQLSGSGYKIGSGIILKVMTGDQVAIKVSSWYKKNGATPNNPNDLAANLVANLINSLTGAGGPVHGMITNTQLQNSGVIPLSTTSFINNRSSLDTTKPKAYLNWVLLDEQFKFVQSGSGAQQVGNDQEFKLHTPTSNISKSGYLYVFVSNETPNINVFFDNLQITHLKGPLLEESHYYPFGTEMSGISTHSLPSYVPNRYKANGGAEYGEEEWANGSGLEMYETFYRSYNAQIGKFMQGDPMMEATVSMSGNVFSGNNPVMFTDLLGDQYKYMDSRGDVWHHRDPLEGTPMAGTAYMEGWGVDGFGGESFAGGSHKPGGMFGNGPYAEYWEDLWSKTEENKPTTYGDPNDFDFLRPYTYANLSGVYNTNTYHDDVYDDPQVGQTFILTAFKGEIFDAWSNVGHQGEIYLDNNYGGSEFGFGTLNLLGNTNIVPISTSYDVNYELSKHNYGIVSSTSYAGMHVSKDETGIINLNTSRLNGRISGGSITLLKTVSLSGNLDDLSITPGIHIGGFEIHAGVTLLVGVTIGASYSDSYGQSGGDATMSVGGLILATLRSGKNIFKY